MNSYTAITGGHVSMFSAYAAVAYVKGRAKSRLNTLYFDKACARLKQIPFSHYYGNPKLNMSQEKPTLEPPLGTSSGAA